MLTTPARLLVPPPPPDPRFFADIEAYSDSQDFLIQQTLSAALLYCLNNAVPNSSYLQPYLQTEDQRFSWNALHNFLEELVTYTEDCNGMPEHSQRVSRIALRCGVALGFGLDELSQLYWGGALHDIGKLALDQRVLAKTTSLSHTEWQQIRQHPEWGYKVIKQVLHNEVIAEIALTHHEHWDGGGYPNGLRDEAIPLNGRIVAIADTFDAITSQRRYKKAIDKGVALEIIRTEAGQQFDPELVRLFIDSDVLFRSDLGTDLPDLG